MTQKLSHLLRAFKIDFSNDQLCHHTHKHNAISPSTSDKSREMKWSRNFVHRISIRDFGATSTRSTTITSKGTNSQSQPSNAESPVLEYRQSVAPWIPIGKFQKGLLSHLSTPDILRALVVLHICSYDIFVQRSFQMFNLSKKFGPLGEWILRQTFFNQFVGGDTVPRMTTVVQSLQKRGLTLMVAPVLEEDVKDSRSPKETYDDNLRALLDIASMTSSLDATKKPLLQLKMSAIMPANTLEDASRAIIPKPPSAKLIHDIANSIENPRSLQLTIRPSDMVHFIDGFRRADALVKKARDLGVNVVVDAEYFSCKPAISILALALMTRHNGQGYVVGNTIQGYLKDAVTTIKAELELMTKEIGVPWFGKIVRGAYLDRERYLAKKQGYPSPICNTYQETSVSYNRAVQYVLEYLSSGSTCQGSHLVVATHNEQSIRIAAQTMKELGFLPHNKFVSFAQIYGMADYLSTPLVQQGYQVYKSTPFGPIGRVMPYLARRASENRFVMEGAREERSMLLKEVKARITSF